MLPLEKIPFTLVSGEAWEKGGPLEPNRAETRRETSIAGFPRVLR